MADYNVKALLLCCI